jgi:hypothetical protein
MKIELVNYKDDTNGISLCVVPETPVEEELLRGLWRHGSLGKGYPTCGPPTATTGFFINAYGKGEKA